MFPGFTPAGLLPPTADDEPYPYSLQDVRKVFVDDLGAPEWRHRLYESLELLHTAVATIVPTARWWLWGCFVSNHLSPAWGDLERLDLLVLLDVQDLPTAEHELEMLMGLVRSSGERHPVNLSPVYLYPAGHPGTVASESVLSKYRARAVKGIADHGSMDLVPAGYTEVQP